MGDGQIWTVKSMDRNPKSGEYLMFASYGSSAHTFTSHSPLQPRSFKPTSGDLTKSNFKDHDDCNVFFDAEKNHWVSYRAPQSWERLRLRVLAIVGV